MDLQIDADRMSAYVTLGKALEDAGVSLVDIQSLGEHDELTIGFALQRIGRTINTPLNEFDVPPSTPRRRNQLLSLLRPQDDPPESERVDIVTLGLSRRVYNVLRAEGFKYVDQLTRIGEGKLSQQIRNLGTVTTAEIREKLATKGFELKQ